MKVEKRGLRHEYGKWVSLTLSSRGWNADFARLVGLLVFLGANNAVKLGDFGLSKIIASHDFASTYVGTPFYMSPEICAAERYSHYSDVWSLGCIIYELATRCVPFDARSHVELVMKIKAGRVKPLPERYSRELSEVIAWCLKVDASQRPDMAQLLNVPGIRGARERVAQEARLEAMRAERDAALAKLNTALAQVEELKGEVARWREAGKKMEMEWHAKATLAIDQRVAEAREAQGAELERERALLRDQFDAAVERQVEEKLRLHHASLPQSHGLGPTPSVAVRSNTPPPGAVQAKSQASSFATTGIASGDCSSVALDTDGGSVLDTDISSLSLMEAEEVCAGDDDASPLAQRTKPPPKATRRQPFARAKTSANCSFEDRTATGASPMDVHMADPSPMPVPVAPMSIKGLSLSPRRNAAAAFPGAGGLRRNIFTMANEHRRRPTGSSREGGTDNSGFTDDGILEDGEEELDDSPSRPASGLSNHGKAILHPHHLHNQGDPFKALANEPTKPTAQPPKRVHRPSLGRQQTMPVALQPVIHSRQRSNLFPTTNTTTNNNHAARSAGTTTSKSPEKNEKENRPPSSSSSIPAAVGATTTRPASRTGKETTKNLTPSRKAPAPPPGPSAALPRAVTANNLAKQGQAPTNSAASPGKAVKGRTLVELNQARNLAAAQADEGDGGATGMKVAYVLASPAKWDPVEMGEDMPSPFLAKKGRAIGVIR